MPVQCLTKCRCTSESAAGRSLVLTEQGVRLDAHARESHERTQVLLRELSGLPTADPVILAAGEGAYLFLIGPALKQLTVEGGRVRSLTLGRVTPAPPC